MNSMKESVQRYLAIALMLALPGFAWGQKKTNPPPKAEPAPHASAPAHTSAPAQHSNAPTQHSNAPGHSANTGPANMGHGNATTTWHGNTPNSTMGHGNSTTNARPGAAANGRPGAGANAMGHTNAGGPGAARGNASAHVAPGRQVSLRGGGSASIRPNGQIRSVNRNGMQINRGLHGGRTVVSTHNGARVVSVGWEDNSKEARRSSSKRLSKRRNRKPFRWA